MKAIVSLFVCFAMNAAAQFDSGDDLKEKNFDTLHVYPGKYLRKSGAPHVNSGLYNGIEISTGLVDEYGLLNLYPADRYTVPEKFVVDTSSNTTAYILTCEVNGEFTNSFVVLAVFNENDELIFHYKISWYTALEDAFEETVNTWFFDRDEDGDLDIVLLNELIDYELPNEYADNISGVRKNFLRFSNGDYDFEDISKDSGSAFKIIR